MTVCASWKKRRFSPVRRTFIRLFFFCIIAALLSSGCRQRLGSTFREAELEASPGVYRCRRVTSKIVIDGRLSDQAWKSAVPIRKWAFPWYRNGPKQGATARLLWDNEALYLAADVEDNELLGSVETTDERKVWHDERFEFYFDPDLADGVYRCWEFTTKKHKLDYESRWGRKFNFSWDTTGLEYAIRLDGTLNDDKSDRGYTIEARIPFKNNFERAPNLPPKLGDIWPLGINREDQYMKEGKKQYVLIMWKAPEVEKPDFHIPGAFGKMVFVK